MLGNPYWERKMKKILDDSEKMADSKKMDDGNDKLLTTDTVKQWLLEQAMAMGEFGFRTNWKPEEVFSHWAVNADTTVASSPTWEPDSDEAVVNEAEALVAEKDLLIRRMYMMNANRTLLAQVELEVHQSLLAAGKTQEDINRYIANHVNLRKKVVDLYKLEHPSDFPSPQHQETMLVMVIIAWKDSPVTKNVVLNTHASLEEIHRVLLETSKRATGTIEELMGIRAWEYQLVKGTCEERWVPLLNDADYRNMIKQVVVNDGAGIQAILKQKAVVKSEFEESEELDGNTEVIMDVTVRKETTKEGMISNETTKVEMIKEMECRDDDWDKEIDWSRVDMTKIRGPFGPTE